MTDQSAELTKLREQLALRAITDCPPGVDEMGPYDNKKDAEDDRRGVQRTLDELEKME